MTGDRGDDCRMPQGKVFLKGKIVGAGWNGKCEIDIPPGEGSWSANDTGDINDPESMVSLHISYNGGDMGFGSGQKRSRSDVERMENGDMGIIEAVFHEFAKGIEYKGGKMEITEIRPFDES